MELILINDNKLKIVLTNEDMETMDITCEEIDYDDTGTRRVFWEILDKAKRQTGFDAASDKIFVQVYPDNGGGCFMYISKIAPAKTEPVIYEKKYKPKLYTGVKKKRILYALPDAETLFEVCRHLSLSGYSGRNDIYCDSDKYYIHLEECGEMTANILSEYGRLVNNPYFAYKLGEHCKKLIADNGVGAFYKSMSGIK